MDASRGEHMEIRLGELVTRKSYQNDLLFRISNIIDHTAILHGKDVRLEADAPLEDLEIVSEKERNKREKKRKEREEFSFRLFRQDYQLLQEQRSYEMYSDYDEEMKYFRLPVKVLHVDGDQSYLKKCIDLYRRLDLQVHGVHLQERNMPHEIGPLIGKIQPEFVVITGHDAYLKNKGDLNDLKAYRNSTHFIETVREIRKVAPSLDQLIIFAGACQSHFESLIRAGANFASSPGRINIHALDPVYIVAKVAYTSFMEKVKMADVLKNSFTGEKGIGGIETRGLHRIGMPYIENHSNENS